MKKNMKLKNTYIGIFESIVIFIGGLFAPGWYKWVLIVFSVIFLLMNIYSLIVKK